MARGPRRRLRRNIYKDRLGYEASVYVNGQTKAKRFSFGTPIEQIQTWITATKRQLDAQKPKAPRGTLAADALRYYKTIRHLSSFIARRSEIRAWIAALGTHIHRGRISSLDVRRVRGEWIEKDVAPKTINNRVFALRHLYKTLDGPFVGTPCDGVKPLRAFRRPAVRIDDATIRAIYQQLVVQEQTGKLRSAKTRARFMVFASTGHRPSEIGRAQPQDVDLDRRLWLPRDGKGGHCPGVYLNDDMLTAWKLFVAADAWGTFDVGAFAQVIRNAGLPADLTPYQLRHTVGIALREAGVDMQDVADHLGHKRLETTRRHYVPVLGTSLQRASEALDIRRLWTDKLPDRT